MAVVGNNCLGDDGGGGVSLLKRRSSFVFCFSIFVIYDDYIVSYIAVVVVVLIILCALLFIHNLTFSLEYIYIYFAYYHHCNVILIPALLLSFRRDFVLCSFFAIRNLAGLGLGLKESLVVLDDVSMLNEF